MLAAFSLGLVEGDSLAYRELQSTLGFQKAKDWIQGLSALLTDVSPWMVT